VKAKATVVNIPDANLRGALEEALGINAGGDITKEALAGLSGSLNAESKGITNLSGLEHCTGLTTLWLVDNQISDISSVANLTGLNVLELQSNSISDISAVANLTGLIGLGLSGNQISDITALANLTNLTQLHLYGNAISDISPLANLTNLTNLNLQNNPLNADAYTNVIPTLKARTVDVTFDAPTNQAPVANDQSVAIKEGEGKEIILSSTDVDGDTLTYTVVSQPSNGMLSGLQRISNLRQLLVYTSKAGFAGLDSFTFKANDGKADSNTATISITVTAVNDAPVANAQSVSTNEDTAKSITLSASDAEGDALTYTVVNQPSNGTLSGTAPSLTYAPNAGFSGSDSFAFKANDGSANSNTATVSITVTAVNDAPYSQCTIGDHESGYSQVNYPVSQ